MEKRKQEEARGDMNADLIEGLNKWREKHPRATMREIEEEIDRRMSKMRARLITDTVMRSASTGHEKREERNVPEMRRGGKEEGEEETEAGNERRAGDRVRTGVCDMSELWTWFFPLSMRSWNYWQGN